MKVAKKVTIHPSITSQIKNGAMEKLKEANELGLIEVAFFPTGMTFQQRKNFYKQLKKSSIKKIPCLHLRNDMEEEEITWLIKTYKIKFLNIHSQHSLHPFKSDLSFCKDKIYVENSFTALKLEEVNQFAGVCLDFDHLENSRRLKPDWYQKNLIVIKKTKIGWGHLGAMKIKTHPCPITGKPIHDSHHFSSLSEFDYLKKYTSIFPRILVLELENSLKEQLKAKEYIEKMFEEKE